MRHLLLDTTTLIAYERGSFDITGLDDDDVAIAAVTVAEFRTGIELADSAERAAARACTLDAILSAVTVLDYTEHTAAEHARLLAHVRRTGVRRGAHDLIIAAHAAQTGRALMSLDAKAKFAGLPGVTALSAPGGPHPA